MKIEMKKEEYETLVAMIMGLNMKMNGIAKWNDIMEQHLKVSEVLSWIYANTEIVE